MSKVPSILSCPEGIYAQEPLRVELPSSLYLLSGQVVTSVIFEHQEEPLVE